MHEVRLNPQSIDNQCIKIFKFLETPFGDMVAVGDVGKRADAIPHDGQRPMVYPDGLHSEVIDRKGRKVLGKWAGGNLRRAGVALFGWYKCVRETCGQSLDYPRLRVEGDASAGGPVEWPNVIQPRDVVAMLVGDDNGIKLRETVGEHLMAEVRTNINRDTGILAFYHGRRTEPPIVWIA